MSRNGGLAGSDSLAHRSGEGLPGVGHAAPLTHPEELAKALTELFAASPEVQLQL